MATRKKEYGIFYKSKGEWVKNPWTSFTYHKEELQNIITDAKEYLKSQLMVLEFDGENWLPPSKKINQQFNLPTTKRKE